MGTWKVITGLVLGLILQLSQLSHGFAACSERSSACQASSTCHCCDTKKVCPCAKSSKGSQLPTPAVPDSKPVKLDPLLPTGNDPVRFVSLIPPSAETSLAGISASARVHPGVSLNVSFCRFTI
jgi:hypothetical protein